MERLGPARRMTCKLSTLAGHSKACAGLQSLATLDVKPLLLIFMKILAWGYRLKPPEQPTIHQELELQQSFVRGVYLSASIQDRRPHFVWVVSRDQSEGMRHFGHRGHCEVAPLAGLELEVGQRPRNFAGDRRFRAQRRISLWK